MRKFFTAVLGLSVAAVLVYGAIGSGATFSFQGTASQNIQIGRLGFRLSSSDGSVNNAGDTVTCRDLSVTASSNVASTPVHGCYVTLTTTGDVSAAVSVYAHVDGATTLTQSSWDSFALYPNADHAWASGGTHLPLSTPNGATSPALGFQLGVMNSAAQSNSVTFDFKYDWGTSAGTDALVNDDMGKLLQLTFTFSASELNT